MHNKEIIRTSRISSKYHQSTTFLYEVKVLLKVTGKASKINSTTLNIYNNSSETTEIPDISEIRAQRSGCVPERIPP